MSPRDRTPPPPTPTPPARLSKAAIFIIFSLSFGPGWKQTTGRVEPHLASGGMARLHGAAHRQTAATGGEDGNKSPPRRSNYRACSSCTTAAAVSAGGGGSGGGETGVGTRGCDDGVKGRIASSSNQPSGRSVSSAVRTALHNSNRYPKVTVDGSPTPGFSEVSL